MKLNVGELIPLELQLSDGNTAMFPRALVYDASNTLLATKDLAHVAQGRYKDDSLTMTNTAYTAVTYIVYSDAGHTTLAGYAQPMDVWQLATAGNTAIAAAILASTLEGTVTVGRALRGLVRTLFASRRSGYDTGTVVVRDIANSKDSHTMVTTSSGWTSTTLTDLD